MAEGEVGRLYVTIGGRMDDLSKTLDNAQRKLEAFGVRAQAIGRIMTLGLTTPIVAGMTLAVKAAMEQENATNTLRASLSELGAGTEAMVTKLSEFASAMQKVTVYGDESIQMAMAYGKNLGITTDKLEAATKAAIGLAARFKLDLNTAMMLVGRASQGQTQMLTRYGIVLDDTLSPQDKFNKLLEIGADSFHLAEAETETATGRLKQFKNEFGDLMEQFGDSLLPIMKALTERMREVVRWFGKLSPETKATAVKIAGLVAAIGPALMALGSMARGVGVLRVALNALAMTPWGRAITIGITALTALYALLRKVWQQTPELREAVERLGDQFSELWGIVRELLWPAVKDLGAKLWELFKPAVLTGLKAVIDLFVLWATKVAEVVEAVTKAVDWFTRLLGLSSKAAPKAAKPAAKKGAPTAATEEVSEAAEEVVEAVKEEVQKGLGAADVWEAFAKGLREKVRPMIVEAMALDEVTASQLRMVNRVFDAMRTQVRSAYQAEVRELQLLAVEGEDVRNRMLAAGQRYIEQMAEIDRAQKQAEIDRFKELERVALASRESELTRVQSQAETMQSLAEKLHDRLLGFWYGETAVRLVQLDRQQKAEEAAAKEMFGNQETLARALSLIQEDYDLQRDELHANEADRVKQEIGWARELKAAWTDPLSLWRRFQEAGANMRFTATPRFDQQVTQTAMMDMRPVDSKLGDLRGLQERADESLRQIADESKRTRLAIEALGG